MTYGIVGYSGHDTGPHGWNTLPLGAGGLVTGFSMANDGTLVCRSDVGGMYLWSGTTADYSNPNASWQQVLNFSSVGGSATLASTIGGWEYVVCPTNSSVQVAVFLDMAGAYKHWIWYTTDKAVTWNKSNVQFLNASAETNSPAPAKLSYYKAAIDPANVNVAYCGMPYNSGNAAGVMTSLNKAGGSTLATWASVKISGATVIPDIPSSAGVASSGIVIDPSQGTASVGGQTVTKHVILPVGGVGIYESMDGGNTFAEIAVTAFGTSSFWVTNGACNSAGVYYAVVVSSVAGAWGIWRYVPGATAGAGTWTKISTWSGAASGDFVEGSYVIIDPRSAAGNQSYLSFINANHGAGVGFTSTNANSGSPTWNGDTGAQFPYMQSASYDIPYINYIFGQQAASAFTNITSILIDQNGHCWGGGNQSFFYLGTSQVNSTPTTTLPSFVAPGSAYTTYWWSMGRGMESTVAVDVLVPPGGTYPILAPQDVGAPMRGTFTSYPQDLALRFFEGTVGSVEYAASDPTFLVATATGEHVNTMKWCYSASGGADGSWTQLANQPEALWNSGGSVGTYQGQVVAVDHDNWFGVPQGFASSFTPGFTSNATTTSSWSLSTGLPAANWIYGGYFTGVVAKPFAVGYGTDLNTVWAVLFNATTTATLYRSTDKGQTFASVATFATSAASQNAYLYSVPGFPDELWITASFTGGANSNLWHVTGARTAGTPTVTAITNLPVANPLPGGLALGAPATPGGYPTIYYLGQAGFTQNQKFIYRGSYPGTGSTVTWTLMASPGDLPKSCNLCGIAAIKADPNVYQRIYVASNQCGYAYYTP